MGIVIAQGRDPAFETPEAIDRAWADAVRLGLERAGMADPGSVDISGAFYGDIWPATAPAVLPELPTEFQTEVAAELLSAAGTGAEPAGWDSVTAVAGTLDEVFGVGEATLTRFLRDLDEYFRDPGVRGRVMTAVRSACVTGSGGTLLLAHRMGSIIVYDLLATYGARSLGVTRLVTFGSPLGLPSVRRRLDWFHPGTPFPDDLATWTNVYNRMDFAAAVPELADQYVSKAGRRIADLETPGPEPALIDRRRAHEAIPYLTSTPLAQAVLALVEPAGNRADRPAESAARAVRPPEPSDPSPMIVAPPPAGDLGHPPDPAPPTDDAASGRSIWDRLRGVDRGPTRRLPRNPAPSPPLPPATVGTPIRGERPTSAPPTTVETPAATDVAGGTKVIERTASANFPPVVQPGSTHELVFAISRAAIHGQSTALAPMEVPADQKTMVLRVGVYAADFDVSTGDDGARTWAEVTVDLVNADAVAEGRFRLTAHPFEGRRETPIYLTFYRGNLPVGQLMVLTAIDPDLEIGVASISVPLGGAPDPEYVLVVTDQSPGRKGAGPFDISVSKEGEFLNMPLGSFPVSVDAWEYASRRLEGFRKVKDEPSPDERIRAAQVLGIQLWNDLPDTFRRFYWEELHGREGASIAVYSQEPYLPWELIKPQREPGGEEDGFLGAVFNMARWKQAVRFPDPLTVSRFSVIAPEYGPESGNQPLPAAQREADELVKEFGAEPIPGTRKRVRELLESSEGVQLIHFAGHGEFSRESAEMGSIWLADAPLVPGDLTQAKLGLTSHPFVFLNACEVGERGWALTRIGGWAEAFTDVGFSGFIGPYWAVNDRVALKAALLFYRSLSAGLSVAEAVRHIRLKFYTDDEDPGHPSWLAYTLHSQPNIRIQMPGTGRPTAMATDEAA
jgi:hypothetical protein